MPDEKHDLRAIELHEQRKNLDALLEEAERLREEITNHLRTLRRGRRRSEPTEPSEQS